MNDYMKKSVVAVMMALCVLTLPSLSVARKTYSLAEIEAMNKAGKFTGTERFVIIRGKEASAITGDKTEIPTLVPQIETAKVQDNPSSAPAALNKKNEKENQPLTPVPDKKKVEENLIPAPARENVKVDPVPAQEKAAPAVVSETLAYDKVTPSRFLIMMAREYYGNGDFWVYIYEENKAKLGHPDRITPGTTVLIPTLKKYGVDPGKPADVEQAKRLAKEVYSRYGKKI